MRAIASYFKVGVAEVYIQHVVSIGREGMLLQENFVKLYARRLLLRPCLGPSLKFHNSYQNRISTVATCTLCVIADCA